MTDPRVGYCDGCCALPDLGVIMRVMLCAGAMVAIGFVLWQQWRS